VSSGAQFVVASYAVILFGLVMYVVVLALKSARISREVELLSKILERRHEDDAAGEAQRSVQEVSQEAAAEVEVEPVDR
jgi:CcmD family protein